MQKSGEPEPPIRPHLSNFGMLSDSLLEHPMMKFTIL